MWTAQARFAWPAGIALSPNGDLVVAEANNFDLRRVTPAGVVTTVGHTGQISGIAFNNLGNLYAALPENAAV